MNTYLVVLIGSAVLSLLITPLAIKLARRMKVLDAPGPRKIHSRAIPRIGGLSIGVATLAMVLPVFFLDNVLGEYLRTVTVETLSVICGAVIMLAVGLIDDIRNLRARVKLLAQVAVAVGVCACDLHIDAIGVKGWFVLELGWFAWPATVLWIVGITNAVNLIDGLDGLAAGISAIACAALITLSPFTGMVGSPVVIIALLGSLLGFLVFNWHPAKVFMGDSGSMFIGFLLATGSILCSVKSATLVALGLPALALSVPILDTLFAMLRRALERRPLFSPDRGHVHHRLMAMGVRHRQAVLLILGVTVLSTGLGTFMLFARSSAVLGILLCVVVLELLAFRLVGAVRLREAVTALKHNIFLGSQKKEHVRVFANAQLRLREARSFHEWCEAAVAAARDLGFLELELHTLRRDGAPAVFAWQRPEGGQVPGNQVGLVSHVGDRRSGSTMEIRLRAIADGTLESTTARATFFARLMDENGPATLDTGNGIRPAEAAHGRREVVGMASPRHTTVQAAPQTVGKPDSDLAEVVRREVYVRLNQSQPSAKHTNQSGSTNL